MQVQGVNSQSFKGKNFRVAVTCIDSYGTKQLIQGAKEYSNPQAKYWFEKAQNAKTVKDKAYFLEQMGEYRLIDLEEEKRFNKTFSKWNLFKMKFRDSVRKFEGKINDLFR